MIRLGHGTAPLPVATGEAMGGYADRDSGVGGIQDPLEVHAIVVDAGDSRDSRWALVVADLVCVNRDAVLAVREALRARLAISGAWVAATHTHAGPESGCHPGGAVTPPTVLGRLVEASVAAVRLAIQEQVASRVDVVRVDVTGLAGDRTASATEPQGVPVDLVVASRKGHVEGLLVVTPVHPTVLGAENSCVSADLCGGIRRALLRRLQERQTGGPWVVSATGAAGDISTRFSRRGRVAPEIERLGEVLADAVTPALDEILARKHPAEAGDASAATVAKAQTVTLKPKPASALSNELSPAGTRGRDSRDARLLHVLRQGVEIASRRQASEYMDELSIDVEVAQLPGVTLVAVPAELFLSLGNDIRRRSPVPERTVVLGYTNGYLGYLPTRAANVGYEVLVSPVAPGSGEHVVDVAVDLARRAHDSKEEEQSVV